ncbi:unnamed protein product [Anisakis simplex]|uniref:N-alpha-acetyltransferase 40 (inferred by orthology to a human protein) n=1 Tax=Anisakis simplex TaxID=6269 RepID=A0A0M3KCL5_ANISI|nr:unnamed protein product [Anisakis simplex]
MTRSDVKKRLVKKASKMPNPIESLKCEYPTETLSGEPLSFSFMWGTHLDEKLFEWIFNLFVVNMRAFYELSQWGYDEQSKKQELSSTTSSFEIQVEEKYQSQGIGSIMISMLESLGRK